MADTDDMDIYESVISGERTAEPASSEPVTPQEPTRDQQGRFASENPAPVAETPAQTPAVTTPEVEGTVAAVQAERKKRQDAERRYEELERRLAAMEAKPATSTPAVQEETGFDWANPENYVQKQLTPIQQAIAEMRDLQMETRAETLHGADKLAAAKAAAEALAVTDPHRINALVNEFRATGNPYDNLVKWHERQQTLETVGNDPQAWLQAEIDKKLADPAFLAQAVERARTGAAPVAGAKPNAPLVSLPPSLSRIPASGGTNAAATDAVSDGDMFSSITSARRK